MKKILKVVEFLAEQSFKEKIRATEEEAEQLRIEDEVTKSPVGLQKELRVWRSKKVMATTWNRKVNKPTKCEFGFFNFPDFSNTIDLKRDLDAEKVSRYQRPKSQKW